MIVTLTPEQQRFVEERMGRGDYTSPETLVGEGLKLIEARENYQRRVAELRSEIDIGLTQIDRGEVLEAQQVFDRVLEKNRIRPR